MAPTSVAGKVLADFPLVLAQLDRCAHPDLDPSGYRAGERATKLSWVCPKGPDHRWRATAKARCGAGTGCPACTGHQVSVTNSLAALHPRLAAELRPDMPPHKAATELTQKAHEVVFWECPVGHVYDMAVAKRTSSGQNCPICAGKRVIPETSLAALHPRIAAEWHPTRNRVSAFEVRPQDNRQYWWICPQGHEYTARALHRVGAQSGCPYCAGRRVCRDNSLATREPEIAAELDAEESGFTAEEVTSRSPRHGHWICPTDSSHRWKARVVERTGPNTRYGCPYCSGRRAWAGNNLAVHHPEIASEMVPDLNEGLRASDILPSAARTLTWRCRRNPEHVWQMFLPTRTSQGAGCPRCDRGRRFSRVEVRLAELLATALPVSLDTRFLEVTDGRVEVDIPIPEWQLNIEYDGAHWHKGAHREERDRRKNRKLADAGWTVLRLRQAPLAKLEDRDLVLPAAESDPVDIAHWVLAHLRDAFGYAVPSALTEAQVAAGLVAAERRIDEMVARSEERRRQKAVSAGRGADGAPLPRPGQAA